ncbi:hypothetical protein E4U42_007428 [Claviceps africana]|uniref:CFEM domain-containing protein n=1 Tax=Claviceps africana TaxID=83212 RepID=A0A8K0J303_9HYPO|nr:hypothetical protein E4U42_007428 [Claviceps africana]
MAFPAASANDTATLAVIASLPTCAIRCLLPIVASSPCALTNATCLCSNKKVQLDAASCVIKTCSVKETLNAKNITSTSCGVPIRDRRRQYVAVCNTFGVLATLFVVQRFAYKIWADLDLGPDDWFTLATLVSGLPSTVLNVRGLMPNGIGRDIFTMTPSQITDFSKFFFIMEILYFFQVAALKLALLFFYVRIFPAAPVRRLLWGTIALTSVYGLVFIVAGGLQCRPVQYFWTKWDGEHAGSCLNVNGLAWSNAVISIVLDCWMLAIPMWQLAGLNLSLKRKVGVGLMFCVGTFITVVSILRLRSLVKFGIVTRNPTWDFFGVALWSTVEINVGIICTCMPTVRLFLVRLFPGRLGTTQLRHGQESSENKRGSKDGSLGVYDERVPSQRVWMRAKMAMSRSSAGDGYDDGGVERGLERVPDVKQARLKPSNKF